ncbi:MAG TPA: hypothetical protein VNA69_01525 [Thermoanaerobaculia bacterium]|nr:hypothetical protein [Thermoanaerobaculia bacterium]
MRRIVLLTLLFTFATSAQLSPKEADAIVPVVGSTRGQSNANFKTELQLHNPTSQQITGWLIFHPMGQPAAETDPVLRYDLAAHATRAYADVLAHLGATGLGSLDVFVDRGTLPTVVARAYDDQTTGTTGVTVPLVPSSAVLARAAIASLIAPRDTTRFRFNVGVRSLGDGATLRIVTRNAAGTQRHFRAVTYASNFFEQAPGNVFAGIALDANDSIAIEITAGSAIVYATSVDNQTNDSSLQLLRR